MISRLYSNLNSDFCSRFVGGMFTLPYARRALTSWTWTYRGLIGRTYFIENKWNAARQGKGFDILWINISTQLASNAYQIAWSCIFLRQIILEEWKFIFCKEYFWDKGSADYKQEFTMIDQIKFNRSIICPYLTSNNCIVGYNVWHLQHNGYLKIKTMIDQIKCNHSILIVGSNLF